MRVILVLLLALSTQAWASSAGQYGSEVVTVVPSRTVTASADLTTIGIGLVRHGICLLDVTAITGTLDLYLQSVIAGTDDDYCRFTQISGTGKTILSFSTIASSATAATHVVSDRSTGVTGGQCRPGPIGQLMKVAAVIGTSATFSLTCHFSGN